MLSQFKSVHLPLFCPPVTIGLLALILDIGRNISEVHILKTKAKNNSCRPTVSRVNVHTLVVLDFTSVEVRLQLGLSYVQTCVPIKIF